MLRIDDFTLGVMTRRSKSAGVSQFRLSTENGGLALAEQALELSGMSESTHSEVANCEPACPAASMATTPSGCFPGSILPPKSRVAFQL